MTDAEELVEGAPHYYLKDFYIDKRLAGATAWRYVKAPLAGDVRQVVDWDAGQICQAATPVECLILARQKLAAEREAAMTPEVRKLKIALTAITRINEKSCDYFGCFRDAVNIARKALEES